MKKFLFLFSFFILTGLISFSQEDTVLNRYKQFLFNSMNLSREAATWAAEIQPTGEWSDIKYDDNERGNWKPLYHMRRIRSMAFSYMHPASANFQQPELLRAINLGLEFWNVKRFKCPNWWHNEIGVPQQMRDIIILMRPALSKTHLANALEILAQYKVESSATGANLVWSADLGIHYALLTGQPSLAEKYVKLIVKEIQITTGDGVQPDYSFHQHDKRLQMYQYGGAFLLENIRLAWEFRGTRLAFPEDKLKLLSDFVVKGWQVMARGIHTVPGTMDRSASRKDAMHSADIRFIIPYLKDVCPERRDDWEFLRAVQNGEKSLNGFWYYPYSDFSVYHQKDFSFLLKTISTRTLSTESINKENLKGHLLNSADGYLIRNGKEYFNLMPVWDWEHLPGLTNFKGSDRINRKAFNGSVSSSSGANGTYGFSSMDYELQNKDGTRSITAKKSWFCYDGKVICLVADLKGKNVDTAYTTLDQARWQDPVYVNKRKSVQAGLHELNRDKWIYHNQLLYVPLNISPLRLQLGEATGSWASINNSEADTLVRDRVFMPFLQHQGLQKGQSFGYWLSSAISPKRADKLVRKAQLDIIRNDAACQAIDFKEGILMLAFFEAGRVKTAIGEIAVDKPCLVIVDAEKFVISDPTNYGQVIQLQIKEKAWKIETLKHGFSRSVNFIE